jgi:hypothetical protein
MRSRGQLRDILGPGDAQAQASGSNPLTDMLSLAGIAAIVVKRMMGSSQTT